MVAHTRKRKDRLQEWFTPGPTEAPATTLDEWCTNMEHQGTWGDGLAIHSLAERTGLSIAVWEKESRVANPHTHTQPPAGPEVGAPAVQLRTDEEGWRASIQL